jgi:hypothetical protein
MRPNHQNRRPRTNNGRPQRKNSNPLSRTFESNGPDVKVRGNAQHVAEKYTQLARDAQAAGDPVLAESYLQHSEHYCRLIIVAQSHLHAISMGKTHEEASQDNDDYDELDSEPDRFTFVVPNVGGRNPPQASDETLAGYGPQPHERGFEGGSSAGAGDYPRERQPSRHVERNPERNPDRPRHVNNPDQPSGGHRNSVRRDQYGRRERYQGAPETENAIDTQGVPLSHTEPNAFPSSPETSNGEYQPREGRRDRFGRNRFGRPNRGSRYEGAEGQEGESANNQSPPPRYSEEGRGQEASRQEPRQDAPREPRPPRFEPRHENRQPSRFERTQASGTEGDIGLPAFLTQAPRVVNAEPSLSVPVSPLSTPTSAPTPTPKIAVVASDEPLVKRGRGRPRKVVPEEGFDL